jgi:hypothetical protein
MESITQTEAAEAKKRGLPVTYDEDGNGWIDDSQLNNMLTPYQQKIMDLERRLELSDNRHTAVDEAEKVRQAIISEDEQFAPAANRLRAARKWVEEACLDYARSTGRTQPMTSGEALSQVFDKDLRAEFSNEFDGVDLFDIVTAEDSEDHYRRTLSHIAETLEPNESIPTPKEKMDSRFQRVLNKPSNLGTNANAKAGQLSIYEKIDNLKPQEIMDLSDAQIDALMGKAKAEDSEY